MQPVDHTLGRIFILLLPNLLAIFDMSVRNMVRLDPLYVP